LNKTTGIVAAAATALLLSCAGSPVAKSPVTPAVISVPAAPQAPAKSEAKTPTTAAQAAKTPVQTPVQAEKKAPRIVIVRIPLEVKASVLFPDGSLDGYTQSERDTQGLLLSQTRYTASGTTIEKIEYVYNLGKLASKITKDGEGKLVSLRSYEYGSTGLLIAETVDDANGKRLSSFEYTYGANGKRLTWIVKDAKATPIAETVYTYRNGILEKAELRDGIGRKTGFSSYDYEGDRLVKQSFFDAGGTLLRVETNTWSNGKVTIEERKSAGGAIQQRSTYEYGTDGQLLKKMWEDVAGKSKLTTTYEYSFKEERKTISD